ncbi:MAG TPA: hypothetical protein VMU88_02650 [bacterium]|nr:hypothetical protein [bacterium]
MKKHLSHWCLALALAALPALARAADRHFIYTEESTVQDAGEKDLETYTTYRFGRDAFYSAMDQSLEFEVGLGGSAQFASYLNFTQEFAAALPGGEPGLNTEGPVLDGVSTELKLKLADNVADPLGVGLYFEPEFEPDELDLETKLILDKKMGSWLVAFNLTAEPGFDYTDMGTSLLLRPSLGVGYFLTSRWFIGLEAMNENFYDDAPMRSVLSAGPELEYAGDSWWVAVAFLPQLANIGSSTLDFTDSQRDQVRLATSFSL